MFRPLFAALAAFGLLSMTPAERPADPRQRAEALLAKGDYADALAIYRTLLADAATPGDAAAADLTNALRAVDELGLPGEADGLRDAALDSHPASPRVKRAAARSLLEGTHHGFVIDGAFTRGWQRGGGNYVNVAEWDRAEAIRLLVAGLDRATAEQLGGEGAGEYRLALADALLWNRTRNAAWRLQELTDLENLPDRTDPDPVRRTANPAGAPVTADGTPLFHDLPESWEAAETDGERWRWALAEAAAFGPNLAARATLERADFLRGQFGVATLGGVLDELLDGDAPGDAGPWALRTLTDGETIARLATGPERFALPEEHNFIRLYRQVAESGTPAANGALEKLAGVYEDRRQYPAAVEVWDRLIARLAPNTGDRQQAVNRREAIVGAYAAFEPEPSGPAGTPATLSLRYKNAERADFKAYRVDERKWFAAARAALLEAEGTDYREDPLGNVLGTWWADRAPAFASGPIAEWSVELDPPADHTPARARIETPLSDAGLYFVTATLPNGRAYGIAVRRSGLAVVVKPLTGSRSLCVVTDAATGEPVAGARVELVGWHRDYLRPPGRWSLKVTTRSAVTGPDGTAATPEGANGEQFYRWFATAAKGERFGGFGFGGRIFGSDRLADTLGTPESRDYAVSDRPVYRPGDTVRTKVWLRRADYGLPADAAAALAGETGSVIILDPRGEMIFRSPVVLDEGGGAAVSATLADDATLGRYTVQLAGVSGAGLRDVLSFRVEEYRKPEFEVTVDAPDEPIVLGEEFTATVRAAYLFGGPVAGGVVSYKVTRTAEDPRWNPYDPWAWLYGPGYWSFAPGYEETASWEQYGRASFGGWGGANPPEVVAEGEAKLGPDGTFSIPLDTSLAKALHADRDHRFTITAEVTDASRRTETGGGSVLAAAVPFRAYGWADRGWAVAGEPVGVNFTARTAGGEPVPVVGDLSAVRLTGGPGGKTVETPLDDVPEPALDSDGVVSARFLFTEPGRYRVDYAVTDAGHTAKASVVLNVAGADGETGSAVAADGLELIPDRKTYAPGDTAKLLVRRAAGGGTVYLFPRPVNGTVPEPTVLRPDGGETIFELPIADADAPNIFVEAFTVSGGRLHSVVRRLAVPPAERVLEVAVTPAADRYEPGEEAAVTVAVTDKSGEPVAADVALTVYDRAIDQIAGGSNADPIREAFWDVLRYHSARVNSNLGAVAGSQVRDREDRMPSVGRFGGLVLDDSRERDEYGDGSGSDLRGGTLEPFDVSSGLMDGDDMSFGASAMGRRAPAPAAAPMMAMEVAPADAPEEGFLTAESGPAGEPAAPPPTVRENFADTAFWAASLPLTDGTGTARFPLSDDLTGWQVRAWAVGPGTAVGAGTARFVTKKSLLVRLQTPRFLTESDEIVLSALVRSELPDATEAAVRWELGENSPLANGNLGDLTETVTVPAGGEVRVDLRVAAVGTGPATVTATATTKAGPSDAVRQTFPVQPHGTLRTESFAGTVSPGEADSALTFRVPEARDASQTRLEVRFSPSLAAAAVDALPYLAHYPYGCAEQTLNRFLPILVMRRTLEDAGVTLPEAAAVRTNLNASRSGEVPAENPLFDPAEVRTITAEGIDRLAAFARPDGGFGWFPGAPDSDPYITALVVRGLHLAGEHGAEVPDGLIGGGKRFLARRQATEVTRLKRAGLPEGQREGLDWKRRADSLDALIFRVLSDLGADPDDDDHAAMGEFLFRDRLDLPVKAQALLGLAFAALDDGRVETVLSNLRQFLVTDEENQTAYLRLPDDGGWWFWWNNGVEANAHYLELLAETDRLEAVGPKLVKYLLNNRSNGTRWASTRDTAHVVEAFAAYLKRTGEAAPTADVRITLNGEPIHTASVTPATLFTYDGTAVLTGEAAPAGEHVLTVSREGGGPVYFTARVTAFDTREFIPAAGLEVKVTRTLRRLSDAEATRAFADDAGRPDERRVEQNAREDLPPGSTVTSGETVEVELILEAKNDYTYLIVSDLKAAGFEAADPLSGWIWDGGLSAYREFRDERTDFFLPSLPRGRHSLRYRLRAEAPGSLHALPAVAVGMYAPELRGNSDEWTATVQDREDVGGEP